MNKTSDENTDKSTELPPWERFHQWVHCIAVVTFDLELGQAIETVFPGDTQLSPTEKSNICYLSFPDSNSGCTRDSTYHFRIKRSSNEVNQAQRIYSSLVPIAIQPSADYLFGFVHFRQQKNPLLPRGYYQKSVVVLTLFPLYGLYTHVVDAVAYAFYETGIAAIETACKDIDQWPLPIPGETCSLPILGQLLQCRIPCRTDVPQQNQMPAETISVNNGSHMVLLTTVHENNFYGSTKSIISHLQLLWELVMLSEPLVVMAPTPALCSDLVTSLVSLIWPLQFCGDYRPFFTIHDSDFADIAGAASPPSIILGVTNPFFSKALGRWPHILRIGDINSGQISSADKKFKKVPNGKTLDTKPGLYSLYRPFLSHDKSLLKKLLKVGDRPDSVQNTILRRHFLELTQSFMIPLERYLSSLLPLKRHITPFKAIPQANPFVLEDFLRTLEQTGPLLTCGVKGDWEGLYKRFVSSPNFDEWLSLRLKDVDQQLRETHLDVLCSAELNQETLSNRQQVEIVDLVLKVRDKMTDLDSRNAEKRHKLQAQLNNILLSVDDELKSILLSNCGLREAVDL